MERAPVRFRDFWSAVILVSALMAVGRRLYATNWTFGLGTVLLVTLLGVLVGLALGSSKFGRLPVSLLSIGYSLALIPLVMAGLLYKDIAWLERMTNMGGRLAIASGQLVTNQPVDDPILFIAFVTITFWIISLTAGYALTRSGSFVGAILPAGIALLIIQLFDMQAGDHVYSVAVFIFLCLLLLGRIVYVRRQQSWKERHVWISAGAGADLSIVLGVAALALVILAWIVPASGRPVSAARVTWDNLTRSWQARQDLDRILISLRGNQTQATEFYGSTLTLGRQARTGDEIYLSIQTSLIRGEYRYYWRVRTYNLYQDGKWRTDSAFRISISPDQDSIPAVDSRGPTGKFTFTAQSNDLITLVTPPHPLGISRPLELTFFYAVEDRIDPILFRATPSILIGEQYTVRANVYEPTIDDLRQAGTDYPTWVGDHFLQLPENLPEEVVHLAQQVTAGAKTPYDQATAITNYLRNNITYSPTVDSPPANRDPLSWFLFDTKTGFCNYYATAEVLMLRSLGIPARLAVGFAEGEYQDPDQYIIRKQDAHAWPEVYFPGIGWVEFEPTTSQPPLVRLESEEVSAVQGTSPTPETNPQNADQQIPTPAERGETGTEAPPDSMQILTIALSVVSMLVIIGFMVYIFGGLDKINGITRRIFKKPVPVLLKNLLEKLSLVPPNWLARWAYYAELVPSARVFTVVYTSLRRLGEDIPYSQTPAEAAARLSQRMPEVSEEIRILLHECQRSLYSRKSGDLPIARRAASAIRRASRHVARRQH